MAPSLSRTLSGALLLALAYNARPVNADFWEDVDNCELVLNDLPADLTTDFCHDWTYGYEPEDEYVTVTGYPVTVTEYPDAKTCEGEGYSTTTQYPGYTPEPSDGYPQPTTVTDGSTEVPSETTSAPDESTAVPTDSTTAAPTETPGGADVTVTSTIWTTYWTTSTIYEGYPAATPAPYRRQARNLQGRAAWCVDRPCRLVQYDDDTIFEACKKYLGWEPHTKTVNVPGYTVTVTSYPTDCEKKDDGYKPDPYPTEKEESYESDPYESDPYEPEPYEPEPYEPEPYEPEPYEPEPYEPEPYEPEPYPANEDYPEYPPEDAEYESEPYEPGYGEESHDDNHPWEDDSETYEDQPWENGFDNNYSGPDGPKPWDDVDQTSELADAIDAGGYESAAEQLGLDDAPWNALPADFPDKPQGDYGSVFDDGSEGSGEYEGDEWEADLSPEAQGF